MRYTTLGLDDDGYAYVPLYTGHANLTHARVGHPVILAGPGTEDVHVQVTHVREAPQLWHVELHNAGDRAVIVAPATSMGLPRLVLAAQNWTVPAGSSVIVT
jgi:hypothetical protein